MIRGLVGSEVVVAAPADVVCGETVGVDASATAPAGTEADVEVATGDVRRPAVAVATVAKAATTVASALEITAGA
jgi:hypothetical protein